jgi:hypothetical protein
MDVKRKKIIAREGLIFIAYFLTIWMIIAGNIRFGVHLGLEYQLIRVDIFIYYMTIWLLVYLFGRFAIWAIKTLRQKELTNEKSEKII